MKEENLPDYYRKKEESYRKVNKQKVVHVENPPAHSTLAIIDVELVSCWVRLETLMPLQSARHTARHAPRTV